MEEKVRQIYVDPVKLNDHQSLRLYMKELFGIAFEKRQDLEEYLLKTERPIVFLLSPEAVDRICASRYAYDVLLMLGRVADLQHLVQIQFMKDR